MYIMLLFTLYVINHNVTMCHLNTVSVLDVVSYGGSSH